MSRVRTGTVRVDGLRDLNRALKALGPEFQKELKEANIDVATFVANDARSAAYAQGGVAAKAAPSIKPTRTTGSAGVAIGGGAYPFAGGAEFGSIKYKQFQPWRGNDSGAGYFLYPSIRANSDRIVTEYTKALDDIMRRYNL